MQNAGDVRIEYAIRVYKVTSTEATAFLITEAGLHVPMRSQWCLSLEQHQWLKYCPRLEPELIGWARYLSPGPWTPKASKSATSSTVAWFS